MLGAYPIIEDLIQQREIKKAEIQIARALNKPLSPPEHAELLILRARAKLYNGRPEGALDDINRAYQLTPQASDNPVHMELQADCHFARYELSAIGFAERSDVYQAEQLYRAISERFPNYNNLGWINYQLARVLLISNRVDDSITCLQQALQTPSNSSALTAYCYERLGFIAFYEQRDAQRAITFLEKAAQTYPADADKGWLVQLHLLMGRILRDTHRMPRAIQAAETALQLAQSARGETRQMRREAILTAAEILSRASGSEKRVIEIVEQFLQLSRKPQTIDVTWSRAYEMLADAYAQTGQHERAITAYLAALQFNPYHPWEVALYTRIAKSYYQHGDYSRTIQAIARGLDVAHAEGQPVDFQVYDLLGSAHYALKQYEQAVTAFDEALQRIPASDPTRVKIQQYRSYALERLPYDPVTG